jgi:hypothetical protein
MVITLKKASLGWGLGGLVVSLFALGPSGCSSDSASPTGGDASMADVQADGAVDDGPPPPLGVPLPTCTGCPVCGGVLGSPTTGISYCTKDCTSNTDCPTGTACVANTNSPTVLDMQCIKTCASNSDCTAPFICRSDLGTPGSYCWSPFPAPDGGTTTDAGNAVPDAGVAETGAPPAEAGTDAGAPADAATTDAGDGG